jgi:hypothetical protein
MAGSFSQSIFLSRAIIIPANPRSSALVRGKGARPAPSLALSWDVAENIGLAGRPRESPWRSRYHKAAISDKHYTRIETPLYDLSPTIKVFWIVPLVDVISGENHA